LLQANAMKLILSHIPFWLQNKFLIAGVAFVLWIIFFDENDLILQGRRKAELRELKQSKAFYIQEIAKERKALEELKSNPAAIEKFAREQYMMKRDNEELFIIEKAEKE
jgi:cell division protein FtsB